MQIFDAITYSIPFKRLKHNLHIEHPRLLSCSLIVTCAYFLIASTIFSLVAISPNKFTLLRLAIYALQHYNASLRITVTVKTTRYSTFVFSIIYAGRIKIELTIKRLTLRIQVVSKMCLCLFYFLALCPKFNVNKNFI